MAELRRICPVLLFFTGNDMLFLIKQLQNYCNNKNKNKNSESLNNIVAKLSLVDNNIEIATIQQSGIDDRLMLNNNNNNNNNNIKNKVNPKNQIQELGSLLTEVLVKSQIIKPPNILLTKLLKSVNSKYLRLVLGMPHLFYWKNQFSLLHMVIKLFVSHDQQPTPDTILFCSSQTTLEQIECFFERSCVFSLFAASNADTDTDTDTDNLLYCDTTNIS
jgi:hypothetical protein